jgi:hypothetical protein
MCPDWRGPRIRSRRRTMGRFGRTVAPGIGAYTIFHDVASSRAQQIDAAAQLSLATVFWPVRSKCLLALQLECRIATSIGTSYDSGSVTSRAMMPANWIWPYTGIFAPLAAPNSHRSALLAVLLWLQRIVPSITRLLREAKPFAMHRRNRACCTGSRSSLAKPQRHFAEIAAMSR